MFARKKIAPPPPFIIFVKSLFRCGWGPWSIIKKHENFTNSNMGGEVVQANLLMYLWDIALQPRTLHIHIKAFYSGPKYAVLNIWIRVWKQNDPPPHLWNFVIKSYFFMWGLVFRPLRPKRALPHPITTGWSEKTVTSNLFLTDPKISKSVITQWFLGSLYRAVLVSWCFKSVECLEFCLSKLFQFRAFASPYKA